MNHPTIYDATTIKDLYNFADSYPTVEQFTQAVVQEHSEHLDEHLENSKKMIFQYLSPVKRHCFMYWGIYRHLFKIYHKIRGTALPDSYFSLDGTIVREVELP